MTNGNRTVHQRKWGSRLPVCFSPSLPESASGGRPVGRSSLVRVVVACAAACVFSCPGGSLAQSTADLPSLLPGGLPDERAAGATLNDAGREKARALALYFEGLNFARKRDPVTTIERYLAVLKIDPSNLRLAKRLADTYVLAEKLNEALALLENAVRENPDRPEGYIYLSEFCIRQHNNSEPVKARAFSAAKEAVERFPSNARVHGNLVALLLVENEREQAGGVIDRAASRDEKSARFWLDLTGYAAQVWPLRDEANHPRLFGYLKRAVELAGDDTEVLEGVADMYARAEALNEAMPLYQRVISTRPDDLEAREKLARCLTLANKPDEAAAMWQKLLDINPQHERAHEALASWWAKKGDMRKSVAHRAESLKWSGDEGLRDALKLVRDMLAADVPQEALPVLERAEFNFPGDPEVPYHAAAIHRRLGQWDRAAAALGRAATAAEIIGKSDEAAAAQFLNEGFYYEWASALGQTGAIDEAGEMFRKAISLVPKDKPNLAAKSYNGLGYLWLENDRQIDEAGALIQRAVKLEPDNPAFLDSLGWFHFKKGEHAKALEVLQQAAAKIEGDPEAEILAHIAEAQWALGQKTEARETLAKAIAGSGATEAMRARLAEWAGSEGVSKPPEK